MNEETECDDLDDSELVDNEVDDRELVVDEVGEESDTEYFIEEGQTEYAKYIPDVEVKTETKVKIKSYSDRIRDLTQFNNNVYLSATIDKNEKMLYYTKDIRVLIEKG